MYIALSRIFDLAAANTNDPDGIDAEHKNGIFNVGYLLFIKAFDKAYPRKRLKPINIISAGASGNLINNLGSENEQEFNDFFTPFDVVELDEDGEVVQNCHEVQDPLSKEKGWYCDLDKIYFTGYETGTRFRVRYIPEPTLISDDTDDDALVFMPRKFLPNFCKFLAAMQDSIEEEANRKEFADLEFRKYFKDLDGAYTISNPIVI